jgi:lactate permease
MQSVAVRAIMASLPILLIFSAILFLRLKSGFAGAMALIASIALALTVWGMSLKSIGQVLTEGVFLAFFPVILVIFAALFTYNLSRKNGAMLLIRQMLTSVSDDKRIQAVLIAFAFGAFLEATAGFGTAVAIPAAILVSLGFEPMLAMLLCLVANTAPVSFGVMGVPVITLANVTGTEIGALSMACALQMLPIAVVLPCILVLLTAKNWKNSIGAMLHALLCGLAFGAAQTAAAIFAGAELAAICGSIASILALIVSVRIFPIKKPWRFDDSMSAEMVGKVSLASGLKASSPYIAVLVLVLAVALAPQLAFLKQGAFVYTRRFYTGEGGSAQSFSMVANPGVLFLMSGLIGAFIHGMKLKDVAAVLGETIKQMTGPSAAIISVLCMARVMSHSGMASAIAVALARTGSLFPAISPLIGAFGTFITGSDTSSNVLFGSLQKQTALQTGADPLWITAGNATGAAIGKMISPQSIAIAAASLAIPGTESGMLAKAMQYAAILAIVVSASVFLGNLLIIAG